MAVDEKRNPDNRSDQDAWSVCEITWQRSYVACAFVAVVRGDDEEVLRSASFRSRRGGGGPVEAPDAAASLAALEEALIGEGWEPIEEPHDVWYARRFRRSMVPLMQRIAAYRAEGELIAFAGSEPSTVPSALEAVTLEPKPEVADDEPAERSEPDLEEAKRFAGERPAQERLEAERVEAERVEAERVEAERVEAERLEAERLEAERREVERVEAERLEAERLEAERLEAERLEAERLEAERLEAERVEAERVEAERVEAERLEAERREAERLEAERLEAVRVAAERQEAARVEAERQEAERIEAERQEAERVTAEKESPLRDLITSYAGGYDRDLDVRSIYGGETPRLDPERFARKIRRRRR
jgi:hypothetical protein